MARTATEEELTSGIAAVGGLQRLAAGAQPRRDSPFALVEVEDQAQSTKRPGSRSPKSSPGAGEALTERVDFPLSEAMRDELDALSRRIQRNRPRKGKRITSNSVIRVAIRVLLEELNGVDLRVSDECELLARCRAIIRACGRRNFVDDTSLESDDGPREEVVSENSVDTCAHSSKVGR